VASVAQLGTWTLSDEAALMHYVADWQVLMAIHLLSDHRL